ncbi:MAG: NAD-dependent epimerase/dehydratase family protein [Firmicutes bacterium]|nr:NAD-dependent epimerase/dehydratase family protein [Bacillota bacterium]
MRALVTGANGFAGRYLVGFLMGKGYAVLAACHGQQREDALGAGVLVRQLNVTDRENLLHVIDEFLPDEIYHLAGIAATTGEDRERYYEVNFKGTLNLFEAVREAAPQARVLYVGSAAVYGDVSLEAQPITEECSFAPVNHYGASKAAADLLAFTYGAEGLYLVRVRPFNHTGPGQSTAYVCSRLARSVAEVALCLGEPVITAGNIDAARDFTDVRDVVCAYWLLLQRGSPGEAYNVCSGRAYTVREITGFLAQVAGVEVELKSTAELRRRIDIPLLVGSAEKIRRATGWQPEIPICQTLGDLFEWWRGRLLSDSSCRSPESSHA